MWAGTESLREVGCRIARHLLHKEADSEEQDLNVRERPLHVVIGSTTHVNSSIATVAKEHSRLFIFITYFSTVVPLTSCVFFPIGLSSLLRHYQQVL